MQTTQPLYRLDYHGDDVPEYLTEAVAELTLECSYHTAAVVPTLLEALRKGRRVHVVAGVLWRC